MKLDWRRKQRKNITRGLRFRLTLTYVVFFSALLVVVGVLFRQRLEAIQDQQDREVLDEEWAAVKGYLRWLKGAPIWFYDRDDPDEALIVNRLQHVILITDATGKSIYNVSPTYRSLGIDDPKDIVQAMKTDQPHYTLRTDPQGAPYMIRSGPLTEPHQRFFLAIGRSIAPDLKLVDQFTATYFTWLPVLILTSSLLGWLIAGRALRPVTDLASTAQNISGSNLNAEIPTRGAGDELDHLIESFNRMIERLSSAFIQTRQFSTDVSHELRTPITAIRGQLEVALFTADTVEQYREAMENALQDIERLSQLIKTLLLLSQAETGQLGLQLAPLDLAEVARDIVEQYQIPAEGARVKLEPHLPERCLIEGDRLQLERLLYNLLSNAVKFTPAGGRVDLRLACLEDSVELVVEDTGTGIPQDHLPHIFDRFYRVPADGKGKRSHGERGLGLGLSFVAWIVKAHRGEIHVDSELGKGTRFTVRLPLGQVEGNGDAADSAATRVAADR